MNIQPDNPMAHSEEDRQSPPSAKEGHMDRSEGQSPSVEEAISNLHSLGNFIRHSIADPQRQRRLRDLLSEIEFELRKDQYHRL